VPKTQGMNEHEAVVGDLLKGPGKHRSKTCTSAHAGKKESSVTGMGGGKKKKGEKKKGKTGAGAYLLVLEVAERGKGLTEFNTTGVLTYGGQERTWRKMKGRAIGEATKS